MIRVTAVQPESIAEELGLAVGTELLAVNGRELEDFLDWEFLTAEEEFLLHVRQPDGEEIEFEIERPLGEPIGRRARAGPDPPLRQPLRLLLRGRPPRRAARGALHPRRRLPPLVPLRQFRDAHQPEAARTSSASSSIRLSPLYVSVHATDPTVRRYLLRNPTAPDILPQLRQFADHGIAVPHPDRDVARRQRRRGARADAARAVRVRARRSWAARSCPVGLTEFSKHHLVREPTAGGVPRRHPPGRGPRRRRAPRSAACTGPSAPTSSTSGRASSCRRPRSTTASTRWRTASAACAGSSGRSRPAPTSCTGGRGGGSAW